MNIFAQSLGLISESDQLSLSEGLHVANHCLYDDAVGARHELKPKAEELFTFLQSPQSCGDFLSETFRLQLTDAELAECITFLDSISGLNVTRTLRERFRVAASRLGYRLRGIRLRTAARRYEANGSGLVRLITRSMSPIALLVFLGLGLAYGANLLNVTIIFSQIAFLLCLFTSTWLHEATHIYIATIFGADTQLISRGLRLGMVHSPLTIGQEVSTALAGPLAGSLCALVLASILRGLGSPVIIVFCVVIVAPFHLVSLVPVYGDGLAIRKYLRSRYA